MADYEARSYPFIAMNKEEAKELFGCTEEIVQSHVSNLGPDRVEFGVVEVDFTREGIPFGGSISIRCNGTPIMIMEPH